VYCTYGFEEEGTGFVDDSPHIVRGAKSMVDERTETRPVILQKVGHRLLN